MLLNLTRSNQSNKIDKQKIIKNNLKQNAVINIATSEIIVGDAEIDELFYQWTHLNANEDDHAKM